MNEGQCTVCGAKVGAENLAGHLAAHHQAGSWESYKSLIARIGLALKERDELRAENARLKEELARKEKP